MGLCGLIGVMERIFPKEFGEVHACSLGAGNVPIRVSECLVLKLRVHPAEEDLLSARNRNCIRQHCAGIRCREKELCSVHTIGVRNIIIQEGILHISYISFTHDTNDPAARRADERSSYDPPNTSLTSIFLFTASVSKGGSQIKKMDLLTFPHGIARDLFEHFHLGRDLRHG